MQMAFSWLVGTITGHVLDASGGNKKEQIKDSDYQLPVSLMDHRLFDCGFTYVMLLLYYNNRQAINKRSHHKSQWSCVVM